MISQLLIGKDKQFIIKEKIKVRAGDFVCVQDIDETNEIDNSFFVTIKRRRYDLIEALPTTLDKIPPVARIKLVALTDIAFLDNELRQVQ